MSCRLIPALLLVLSTFAPTLAQAQRPLTLICNQYPPFTMSKDHHNFARDSQIIGLHADGMRALMQRAGVDYNLTLRFPYQRLLKIAQKKSNTAIFTVDRTAERDALYQWVGPLDEQHWAIFSTSSQIPAVSRLDVLAGKTVIAQRGQAVIAKMKAKGLKVIETTNNAESIALLTAGKADLWAVAEHPGEYLAEQEGIELNHIYELAKTPSYLALNRETDPALVAKLQQTLEEMQADGSWYQFAPGSEQHN